jgi:hypothetical protein
VDLYATPEELRAIGNFLLTAAAELEAAQSRNSPRGIGIELRNSATFYPEPTGRVRPLAAVTTNSKGTNNESSPD